MSLNFFDNIVIIIASLSLFFGIMKGAIKTLIDIAAIIATISLTMWLLPYSYEMFNDQITGIFRSIIGLIVCYIFSLIAISLSSKNIKTFIEPITGGYFDRICGGVIGLVRAWVMIRSLFIFASIIYDKTEIKKNSIGAIAKKGYQNHAQFLTSAASYNLTNNISNILLYIIPHSLKDKKFQDFELYKNIIILSDNKKTEANKATEDFQLNDELQKALKSLEKPTNNKKE